MKTITKSKAAKMMQHYYRVDKGQDDAVVTILDLMSHDNTVVEYVESLDANVFHFEGSDYILKD